MRLFRIDQDDRFQEFRESPFELSNEEAVLESWLEANPDGIVEDGSLLIIGRQVKTNLGGLIDLLALDQQGDVVVIELKRDRTPRDTLAQALEYASFVSTLDADGLEDVYRQYVGDPQLDLATEHREAFRIPDEDALAFNKSQRIVIVGQRITPEVRQTSRFLRGIGLQVTCLEFSFFEAGDGGRMMSTEIVVGQEPMGRHASSSRRGTPLSRESFLERQPPRIRAFHERLMAEADSRGWTFAWGPTAYSLGVDRQGVRAPFCFCYDAQSSTGPHVYSARGGQGGLKFKVKLPDDFGFAEAQEAGISDSLLPAGQDWKYPLSETFTDDQIDAVIRWLVLMADRAVRLEPL
jgi:hypothetical protein